MCWHLQEDAHDFLRQWLDKAHDCHEKLLRQHCPAPQARLMLLTLLASSALLHACQKIVLLEHHLTVTGTYMPNIVLLEHHATVTGTYMPKIVLLEHHMTVTVTHMPKIVPLALDPCSIYPPWLIMHVMLQTGGALRTFVYSRAPVGQVVEVHNA